MLQAIKFPLDTRNLGLKLDPRPYCSNSFEQWDLHVHLDANWGADTESRKSITGFAVHCMGCLVSWRSKQQSVLALSSAESEYYALCEAGKEIKFVVQLLANMNIPVRLPVVCQVDNMAAIFMAKNTSSTPKTHHIDIKHRWVSQLVEEGFLKILFVQSADNPLDEHPKNVSPEVCDAHMPHCLATRES